MGQGDRRGRVFKRCTKCGDRVEDRRCARCDLRDSFTWAYVVDVTPKDAGGKLVGRRQQRKKGGFASRAAAQAAMAKLQVEKAEGTYVEPSKLTVGRFLQDWAASGCGGVRGSTLTGYQVCVRLHLVPHIGAVILQSLTKVQLRALYRELAESGNRRTVGGLSPKSVHNVHICLHAALESAREDGLIRTNPADSAHRNPKKDRPEMKTWTIEEVRAFLAHVAGRRDFALYRLALNTGMRRGELLGLRWRDLDLDSARLHVRQQWSRQAGVLVFGPPKSERGRRTIDLDAGTISALKQHRLQQEFERRSWGPAYRSELDLVTCRADGSSEDPDVVGHRFDRLVLSARLPDIRFHDQRHTHATLLLEDGIDAKYVSERLGHDSVQTTLELYGHVTPKRRADAVARISALVDGPAVARDQSVTNFDSDGVANAASE